MSQLLTGRLAAPSSLTRPRVTVSNIAFQTSRPLSQTSSRWNDTPTSGTANPAARSSAQAAKPQQQPTSILDRMYGSSQSTPTSRASNPLTSLSQTLGTNASSRSSIDTSALFGRRSSGVDPDAPAAKVAEDELEPFHLHIYAHKHNTHVTCTRPNRDAIISLSCGNIGFRKARRGGFDSAYSLTKYVLERLIHMGWPPKMKRLEVVMRGFGKGREAAIKVLLSPEGKVLRDKIVRVSDSTRVKFAGTRSKRMRRL